MSPTPNLGFTLPPAGDPSSDMTKLNTNLMILDGYAGTVNSALGGISGAINFADGELPAGVVNGVNQVFTLAHTPNPTASLQLYVGLIQRGGGNDYTLAGATITFIVAPASQPMAWYRY